MEKYITRQKFTEIVIIAILSAVISSLQAILAQFTAHPMPVSDPVVALITGGTLGTLRHMPTT